VELLFVQKFFNYSVLFLSILQKDKSLGAKPTRRTKHTEK